MTALTHKESARQINTVDTCKLIRQDLKAFFPGVKFSVTTKHYASISIHWTDGPTQATVDAVTKFYQCASFDGMTDSTSYHDVYIKGERVHFAANFVQSQRAISLDFIKTITPIVCRKYGQNQPTISADKWGNAEFSGYDPAFRCGHDDLRDLIFQACHNTDSRHVEQVSSPAEKFREAAKNLQTRIDDKRKPHDWNLTARRANIEHQQELDARNLETLQSKLIALADAWDSGYVNEHLRRVITIGVVELLINGHMPDAQTNTENFKRLVTAGLGNDRAFQSAVLELSLLGDRVEKKPTAADTLRDLETKVRLSKIAGFFPTPAALAEKMIAAADLRDGLTVLEPSAGKGDIAALIPKSVTLDTIERNFDLRHILEIKGLGLIVDCYDFLEFDSKHYDRIIMNPPFENLADIDHVRHAYDLLNPGGRIVAIMSESPFFRETTKAVEFRAWLDNIGTSEKLEAGTFKQSDVPTSVNTRLVIIDKPVEKGQIVEPEKKAEPPMTVEQTPEQSIKILIDSYIADAQNMLVKLPTYVDLTGYFDKCSLAKRHFEALCKAQGLALGLLFADQPRHTDYHKQMNETIELLKGKLWDYIK